MIKENTRFSASTVFEGMTSLRAVIDAAQSGISDRRLVRVLYDREREAAKARELAYLRRVAGELQFSLIACDTAEIDARSTGTSHGGILAECTERTIPAVQPNAFPDGGFSVMIEGIEDPYNFGYALRSLYAAGVDTAILTPRNWMSAAGVVCRSSAGASERLPLYTAEPIDAVKMARERGYKIVCAGIRDSVSAFDADLSRPIFLVVGGEKRGISRAVLEMADTVVRLDYGREFHGSLSAASAASILGYEVLRQNRNA